MQGLNSALALLLLFIVCLAAELLQKRLIKPVFKVEEDLPMEIELRCVLVTCLRSVELLGQALSANLMAGALQA